MKTSPTPTPPALQADPKIVRKTRRDKAAYAAAAELPGEQDHDYLPQHTPSPQDGRSLEFGRPGL